MLGRFTQTHNLLLHSYRFKKRRPTFASIMFLFALGGSSTCLITHSPTPPKDPPQVRAKFTQFWNGVQKRTFTHPIQTTEASFGAHIRFLGSSEHISIFCHCLCHRVKTGCFERCQNFLLTRASCPRSVPAARLSKLARHECAGL